MTEMITILRAGGRRCAVEALGLAGLCVAILAALMLPV